MSDSDKTVIIQRSNENGRWSCLTIKYVVTKRRSTTKSFTREYNDDENRNIDDAITTVMDRFLSRFRSDYLQNMHLDKFKCDVVKGFHQMEEIDLNRNTDLEKVILFLPKKQPEPHLSCKMNENEDSGIRASGENESSQSEVQQKLSIVDKNSDFMKFFTDNKCSVCHSNYKEIFDDNFHIVIPSCGHPLCCKCADTILKSRKKECPRCRGNIRVAVFNLMKFNADLQMETRDQTVFL